MCIAHFCCNVHIISILIIYIPHTGKIGWHLTFIIFFLLYNIQQVYTYADIYRRTGINSETKLSLFFFFNGFSLLSLSKNIYIGSFYSGAVETDEMFRLIGCCGCCLCVCFFWLNHPRALSIFNFWENWSISMEDWLWNILFNVKSCSCVAITKWCSLKYSRSQTVRNMIYHVY